jgi:CubicO group peptidase (beta-lactamase class C family)
MKKILLCFSVLVSGSAVSQSIDTLQQIDRLFSGWNNSTPGGAILVARGNTLLYHKAYGLADLEHLVPTTVETIFESGSVAKQFTAASILLLAKEGKLSLHDEVHKYIPELPIYQKPITLLHLLNHTSGLKDWGSVGSLTGWPRTTRVYTNDLALHIICQQKSLNFNPGSEYSYSNSNYTLLVFIVERVSKQKFADFTKQFFFDPLGMHHTKWRDAFTEVIPNRAIAYFKSNGIYQQNMPFENVHGHGGLLTTTEDLLKWNQLLETHSILGDQAAAWRIDKGILTNGTRIHYAAGITVNRLNDFTEISHSGATAGYRAWLAYYPLKKLSVVFLSNDGNVNIVGIGQKVAQVYLGTLPATTTKPLIKVDLPEKEKEKWVGFYRSIRGFDYFSIASKNKQLYSNEKEINTIHQDTLVVGNSKWVWLAPTKILLINPGDTTRYVRVMPADISDKSISSLPGTYSSDEAGITFTMVEKDKKLLLLREPHPSISLTPVFKDAFRDEDFVLYEFKRDKNGAVNRLEVSMSRALKVPFVRVPIKK